MEGGMERWQLAFQADHQQHTTPAWGGQNRSYGETRKVAGVEWPPEKGMNSWQLGLSEA
jgi:hypothetical protein